MWPAPCAPRAPEFLDGAYDAETHVASRSTESFDPSCLLFVVQQGLVGASARNQPNQPALREQAVIAVAKIAQISMQVLCLG